MRFNHFGACSINFILQWSNRKDIKKIYKNKQYSFIQIDRLHRYNTNSNSLKTKRMNL